MQENGEEFKSTQEGPGASYALVGAAVGVPAALCAQMCDNVALIVLSLGALLGFACALRAMWSAMKSRGDGVIPVGVKTGAAILLIANCISVAALAFRLLYTLGHSGPWFIMGVGDCR